MNFGNNEPCPHCGRYNNRRIAVDALIIQSDTVLLIKRGVEPFKDIWALPGGGIDFDETSEDALKREVEEEVGMKIKSYQFFKIYSDPRRDPKQVIALSYLVEAEGNPKSGSDAISFKFFPINDLPELMAFDHKKIISDYLESK